jgi:hypothetical protein
MWPFRTIGQVSEVWELTKLKEQSSRLTDCSWQDADLKEDYE